MCALRHTLSDEDVPCCGMAKGKAAGVVVNLSRGLRHTSRPPSLEIPVRLVQRAGENLVDAASKQVAAPPVPLLLKIPLIAAARVKPVVQGPIRCHTCQLKRFDAKHYLTHKCEIRRPRI